MAPPRPAAPCASPRGAMSGSATSASGARSSVLRAKTGIGNTRTPCASVCHPRAGLHAGSFASGCPSRAGLPRQSPIFIFLRSTLCLGSTRFT